MLAPIFIVSAECIHPWGLDIVFQTRLTRRVPLEEQELLTLPEHVSSPPVFSGVRVTQSLVLCVCLVDRCLSFCTFSFGHCVVCSSSIYDSDYPIGIFKLFLQATISRKIVFRWIFIFVVQVNHKISEN